ncbi:uncharacterized protein LOC121370955 [Gigantopelta aegis]|uniref:uncharacterized protein LOC121370955 n=1 Tax=Gigantopelta aegis TaxID=1735272 RepID=UPI001B88D83B|nr:uncharacterized protein LOC121370955 [Gigantopelta aegis]XP_041352445.1 uncharacterized protein LOC121370955 [Gigantopelta aegis]
MAEQSKEDKEIVSHQCNLCKLSYTSEPDLREHFWSLMHHMKIEEKKKNSLHNCTLCYAACATISEYRKHLSGDKHQKAVEKYSEECKKTKEEREKQSTSVPANQPFEEPDQDIPGNDNPTRYGNNSSNREQAWHDHDDELYPFNARNEQNPAYSQRQFPQPDYHRHYGKQWSKQGQFNNRHDFDEREYYEQQRDFPSYHYSGFRQRYNRDPLERPPRDFGRPHFDQHDDDDYYKEYNSRDSYKRGSHQFGSERRDFNKYSQNGQIERPPRDFAKPSRWDQPFRENFGRSEYPEYPSFDNPHWHVAQWDMERPPFFNFEDEMNYHNRSNREGSGPRMPDPAFSRDTRVPSDDSLNRPKSFQTSEGPEGPEKNESREGSPSVSSSNPEPLEQMNGRKRGRDGEGESSASKASRKAEFISELRKRQASPANSPSRDFLKTSSDNNPFVELAHASLGYTEQQMDSLSSSDRCVTSSKDSGVKKVNSPLQRRRTATSVRPRFIGGKVSPKSVRGVKFSAGKKSNNIQTESSKNGERNSSRNGVLETAEKLCRELREKRQNAQREKEKLLLRQTQKSLNSRIAVLSKTNQSYLKGHLSQNESVSSVSVLPESRIALESSHSHSSIRSNTDLEQASRSDDPRFSSLPLPQRSGIDKIRHEIESSVRGTKRFVRSSCETSRQEKHQEVPPHLKPTGRPVGKGKGPMSKDSLAKMINAPRSRKERLQLAQIVRSHSKTQNKLAPSRLNVQLSGLYDNDNLDFDEEEMSEITLEDLSPQVKMQIARLIEDDIVDFDTGFVSTSPKTPPHKNRANINQLMEVDGDHIQRPAKQEPEVESTDLTLDDLVSPSQPTSEVSENLTDKNNQGDSTVDSGHVTDERVPNITSNEHLESSITDQSQDNTVNHLSPEARPSSFHEITDSRPQSPHIADPVSETSSQPPNNILSSILFLSQKEEEKQTELESVQMRMGRLHNWLQQILTHLANFDVRQTKLQDEIKSLREERIQLISSAMTGSAVTVVPSSSCTVDSFSNRVLESMTSSNLPSTGLNQSTVATPEPLTQQNIHQQNTHQQNIHQQNIHQQNTHQQNTHQQINTAPRTAAAGSAEHLLEQNSVLQTTDQTANTGLLDHSDSQASLSASLNINTQHPSLCRYQIPVGHREYDTTSQTPATVFAVSSIQQPNVFNSTSQLSTSTTAGGATAAGDQPHVFSITSRSSTSAAVSVSQLHQASVSSIAHQTPVVSVSDLSVSDPTASAKTIKRSDSVPGASAVSRDRMCSSKKNDHPEKPIKEERVSPSLSEAVSSSAARMRNPVASSGSSQVEMENNPGIFNVDNVRTSRKDSVSEGSNCETIKKILSSGQQMLSPSARKFTRTLSESGNPDLCLTSSSRLSESEYMPSSQSQDEEKSTAMPVKYLGTFRGDLDSTDILQKVAANLGGLNKVNAISYLYLNQKENADVQQLMSTVCVDSSAIDVVNSASEVHLMELDAGSNDNSTRQMTPREESDLGSVASKSSLGEKIKCYSRGDIPRATLDTAEACLSDGDKTLEADDCVQNSDNTPGRILKQCSVVLQKLEITKHDIVGQDFYLMDTGSLSPTHKKKRKTKKERDLISNRKHKYWVNSSSSENASQDEEKGENVSSLKQQLIFQSKSDDNNSDDSQNIEVKDTKDPLVDDRGIHSAGDASSSRIQSGPLDSLGASSVEHKMNDNSWQKQTLEEKKSDVLKVDPKRLKLKPESVEPFRANVMSSVGLAINETNSDMVSTTDKISFVGAQTPVSCLQVYQKELYISYEGMENVKKFDVTSGQFVMEYESSYTEHLVVLKTKMEEIPVKLFVSGSSQILRVFDIRESKPIDSIAVSSPVQCMHSFGSYVYLGLASGEVHVVRKKTHKTKDVFMSADKPIHSITSTKEAGRVLLCIGAQDATISICDSHSGLPIRILEGHTKTAFSIKASQDHVFSGSGDRTVMVHNLHTGDLEWTYSDHKGIVTSVWYWNDLLFSAGFDGFIRCFDLEKRIVKQMYYGAGKSAIKCMAVYGNKLYTGNRKGEVECVSLDLDKSWSCRSPGCKYVFGLRDHLLHHIITDHTLPNTKMMRCPWKDCPRWISTENNTKVVEEHLKKHIDDTVIVIGDEPNIATVTPMIHKE